MPTPLRGSLGILVLTVATLALQPSRAHAQQPPTYDFDPAVPGVQGPTSPLLAAPYTHFFRTISLNVPLLVPAAELQAALPPGFTALPDALGRATVTALFSYMVTDAEQAPVAPITRWSCSWARGIRPSTATRSLSSPASSRPRRASTPRT